MNVTNVSQLDGLCTRLVKSLASKCCLQVVNPPQLMRSMCEPSRQPKQIQGVAVMWARAGKRTL